MTSLFISAVLGLAVLPYLAITMLLWAFMIHTLFNNPRGIIRVNWMDRLFAFGLSLISALPVLAFALSLGGLG